MKGFSKGFLPQILPNRRSGAFEAVALGIVPWILLFAVLSFLLIDHRDKEEKREREERERGQKKVQERQEKTGYTQFKV